MSGLKCTASCCELNNKCHCEAGIINVDSKGVCKTKMKKKFNNIDSEYERMEVAEEFNYDSDSDTLIQCDADDCVYNKEHMCTASRVDIKDGIAKTKCVTKRIK